MDKNTRKCKLVACNQRVEASFINLIYVYIYHHAKAVRRKLASHKYHRKHLETSQLPAGAGSPVVCFASADFARFFARIFADLDTLRMVGG